ncbi:uncharacterized protein A1O9_04636 [Exophiala aquamarina CBS 119918]|uniref:TRAP transporter solute receptor, TAXI family n=1 Tax=Exophiala aquamarina CBS 119918 TaxID=1182545 RepID=A0A072PKG6_9EURO|nr:uncharacterized protein A1O9_04636 [Exophiala aquamarina CBS 119918]KEF59788.1 hypothetical protein A1O9_04636 [Exophiala aquamarina CBS 119918]
MATELGTQVNGLTVNGQTEPRLDSSYNLNFMGDWGGANFHRICAWLTQEFCDRAGPGTRTAIYSLRDGGLDGLKQLQEGAVDLAICTPAGLVGKIHSGESAFAAAMPNLRAIGVLPQNDRMVLALHPKHNINSIEDLRTQKPAIKLVTATDDGTNPIGYVANEYLNAHGISKATIESWGGAVLTRHRPEQCVALVESGEADALLQEAIMTPWWRGLVESNKLVPLAAEAQALESLQKALGLGTNHLPAGWWDNLDHELLALDFSDFVLLVRADMPKEVAHLLTWCLVETRDLLEGQYKHLKPEKSPLTYPLDPEKMSQAPVPLHDGAQEYYSKADFSKKTKLLIGSPF